MNAYIIFLIKKGLLGEFVRSYKKRFYIIKIHIFFHRLELDSDDIHDFRETKSNELPLIRKVLIKYLKLVDEVTNKYGIEKGILELMLHTNARHDEDDGLDYVTFIVYKFLFLLGIVYVLKMYNSECINKNENAQILYNDEL